MDNIIPTILSQYPCPEELQTKYIKSFQDLLSEYKKKYSDALLTISADSTSETLRNELGTYYEEFHSRNSRIDLAAYVVVLERMANLSAAARLTVQKAWLKGAGLSRTDSAEAAAQIKRTGEMKERTASMHDLDNIDFQGLTEITTEALCYDGSGAEAADSSILYLEKLDVSKCKTISELLATELSAWNTCLRELDEAPMATYLRWKNLKSACMKHNHLVPVIKAFTDLASRDKSFRLSKIKSWSLIESKLRDGWEMAQENEQMEKINIDKNCSGFSKYKLPPASDSKSDNEQDEKLSTHIALTANEIEVMKERAEIYAKTASDEKINCRACKKDFTDSVEDQVNRIRKGWDNKPKRCKPCNEQYKQELKIKPRSCIDFARGHCAWGDKCKFIHEEKPNHKLGVHYCQFDSDGYEEQSSGSDSVYSDESSDELDPDCY
jgi:hypothetical protein